MSASSPVASVSSPFALFVRGLRLSGMDTEATFRSASPTYQALNDSGEEGRRFIYEIARYGAGVPAAKRTLPGGIPPPTLEWKRTPEQEAARARKLKRKPAWACPRWTDASACLTEGKGHCFWKDRANQCAEYRYGRQHTNEPSPKIRRYTPRLEEKACLDAGGDWSGTFCRKVSSPRTKPRKLQPYP